MLHGVSPQGCRGTVTGCIFEFAVLEHDFDGEGLDVAAMLHGVSPQGCRGTVTGCIFEFAVLEHDFDGACERFHRDFEPARQARLVVRCLERLPQHTGVVDQAVAGVKRLRHVEAGKAPLAALRAGCLI